MKKIIPFLIFFLFIYFVVNAQPAQSENKAKAEIIYTNIYNHFYDSTANLFKETNDPKANEKTFSYLWPLCALIQCAEEMEAIDPATKKVVPVMKSILQYYDKTAPAPGYASYVTRLGGGDRFYDDNQWIAIALMDAYQKKPVADYLTWSKEIYRFMMTGYDTVSGGGLYWKEKDITTKNTCSNGPGIVLALQLYQSTGTKSYLDTALQLYHWVNKYLRTPNAVYWDNVQTTKKNKIDSAIYSYNTGIMIQANTKLYTITKQQKYLAEAKLLAEGSYRHFFKEGVFRSSYWFNAVLLRGYEELYALDKDTVYIKAMQQYADNVWKQERDSNNLLGKKRVKHLLDQGGMLEIYLRLAKLSISK